MQKLDCAFHERVALDLLARDGIGGCSNFELLTIKNLKLRRLFREGRLSSALRADPE